MKSCNTVVLDQVCLIDSIVQALLVESASKVFL